MGHVLLGLLVIASAAACARADDVKVLNDDAHFAEGPIWYHGKLYYVEYDRNSVITWDGAKNAVPSSGANRIGAIAMPS